MNNQIEQGWPVPILDKAIERKARIAIRGAFGQLGARLIGALGKQPDLEATIGLVRRDPTAELRGFATVEGNPNLRLYTSDEGELGPLKDLGFDAKLWRNKNFDDIDLVIDTTPPGKGADFAYRSRENNKPIIVQSGEKGFGRLVSPPLIAGGEGIIFEAGDCNVNAISVIGSALWNILSRVGVNILMQHGRFFHGRLRDEPVLSTYFVSGKPTQEHLKHLFPSLDLIVGEISQVPSLRYYTHTYIMETADPVDAGEVRELLDQHPRIRCLPHATSTYDVREFDNILRAAGGARLPPIVPIIIRGGTPFEKSKTVEMIVTIDSRRITVLPNIDAARTLLWGIEPIESMRMTDATMHFAKSW